MTLCYSYCTSWYSSHVSALSPLPPSPLPSLSGIHVHILGAVLEALAAIPGHGPGQPPATRRTPALESPGKIRDCEKTCLTPPLPDEDSVLRSLHKSFDIQDTQVPLVQCSTGEDGRGSSDGVHTSLAKDIQLQLELVNSDCFFCFV